MSRRASGIASKKGSAFATLIAVASWMARPATRTKRASFRSRAPPQSGQGWTAWKRSRSSCTFSLSLSSSWRLSEGITPSKGWS
jgi:hypothetical protein